MSAVSNLGLRPSGLSLDRNLSLYAIPAVRQRPAQTPLFIPASLLLVAEHLALVLTFGVCAWTVDTGMGPSLPPSHGQGHSPRR